MARNIILTEMDKLSKEFKEILFLRKIITNKNILLRRYLWKINAKNILSFLLICKKKIKKIPLGGMAWDDICWWIHDATEKDKLFTRNELADMFPDLLGHIREN